MHLYISYAIILTDTPQVDFARLVWPHFSLNEDSARLVWRAQVAIFCERTKFCSARYKRHLPELFPRSSWLSNTPMGVRWVAPDNGLADLWRKVCPQRWRRWRRGFHVTLSLQGCAGSPVRQSALICGRQRRIRIAHLKERGGITCLSRPLRASLHAERNCAAQPIS